MSVELANEHGPLGQFASNAGYSDLIAAVTSKYPNLHLFLQTGSTEGRALKSVQAELRTFSGSVTDDDVRSTALALDHLLADTDLAIITTGEENEESTDKQDATDFELEGEISKVDAVKHLVFGWASVVKVGDRKVKDVQGDIITPETLEDTAYEFVLTARKGGEMHEKEKSDEVRVVSRLIESCVFTTEKQEAMVEDLKRQGIDAVMDLKCVPWWVGFKVDDPDTWKRVITPGPDQLKAFSIGGTGKREKLEE